MSHLGLSFSTYGKERSQPPDLRIYNGKHVHPTRKYGVSFGIPVMGGALMNEWLKITTWMKRAK